MDAGTNGPHCPMLTPWNPLAAIGGFFLHRIHWRSGPMMTPKICGHRKKIHWRPLASLVLGWVEGNFPIWKKKRKRKISTSDRGKWLFTSSHVPKWQNRGTHQMLFFPLRSCDLWWMAWLEAAKRWCCPCKRKV